MKSVKSKIMEARRGNARPIPSDYREEEICTDRIFDPAARRTLNVNPSFRNARRRGQFNAFKFLSQKKGAQEYERLQLRAEEDVHDHLDAVGASADKRRLDLLAEGVLRKIAEYLETLNKSFDYRLLDVNYEKN